VKEKNNKLTTAVQEYKIRKIAKAGNSRYLSVGTILPADWEAVKMFVDKAGKQTFVIRLEQIK